MTNAATVSANRTYSLFLLIVAGLGGLLYGIDVGIIGGALPYLQATSGYSPSELSAIVAAVLLGSVISTLFAGALADWIGRKPLMILSGLCFAISIPIIALSVGYDFLYFGRLLQGISGGLIGVVVPLYLAECLPATNRGKGTGIFQLMLVFGLVTAALVAMYYSYQLAAISQTAGAAAILDFKNHAWRHIFWVSLPPGALFVLGSFFVTESPRWLYRRGKKDQALAALLRSRTPDQAASELAEMEEAINVSRAQVPTGAVKSSLLRKKYVVPFILACVILSCNTATGINSIIPYNTSILMQSGLSDLAGHWGFVIFDSVNFFVTIIAVTLVDRKGRKFLLTLGTTGIIISLVTVGILFLRTEKISIDAQPQLQSLVGPDQSLTLHFDKPEAAKLLAGDSAPTASQINPGRASFAVIYSYGDFTAATNYVRSDDPAVEPITITRSGAVPDNKIEAFFQNPFANFEAAQTAPLKIIKAPLGLVPDSRHGWFVAIGLYCFMASFAIGPGVCVWLALSELMPTRIRSNGMSIALLLNQLVSTTLAGIFLPFVSKYGYSSMFFMFSGFTVVYFITAVFFLPETKGKTLEEIEAHFEGRAA